MVPVRSRLLAGCALVLALGLGATHDGSTSAATPPRAAHALFREGTAPATEAVSKLSSPLVGTSGGAYPVANGQTVRFYSAREYLTADPSFNQHWADFLASAPHGDELSSVTVVMLPLAGVQSYCGAQALACYSGGTIVAPGDDPAPDLSAASVLLHEYGHHIADNRINDPWAAIDYGTKRWASVENICRRTADGMLHPGDEESDYHLNPGEAWAETYRVVAERALGLTSPPWEIVSSSFYPDDADLAAASQDVLEPWSGNTVTTSTGSLTRTQKQRRLRIQTRYDGNFAVTLTNRTKGPLTMQVVDGAAKTLGTSTVRSGRTATVRSSICGQRLVQVRLSRATATAGRYNVTISKP